MDKNVCRKYSEIYIRGTLKGKKMLMTNASEMKYLDKSCILM